ncbi:pimeloyl-ACP methyl ester carboxylesterase [Micromonospora sp. A200]|uniref:alpha/beta hydrolase n=1 Tax=Micromonospora sp. A200 TaxID=2940568 RepID=UPI0024757932|nr:alpha/beta hydrolase [Micromonospora sp. A200]MDH6466332.1 pimeloyl-ACP methyl ester carboxylesterase [Micromonospora sp. A200]
MPEKPTVVLVHGAFADSTAWNPVLAGLTRQDVDAIAVANPLRSLRGDAEYLRDVVRGLDRPVILVGHSYGGMVITEAATDLDVVRGLVYVAAFTPDHGESAFELAGKFAGSTLGSALLAYPVAGDGNEVRIDPAKFHLQFGADLEVEDAILLGRTQRPVTEKALTDGLSNDKPAWKTLPTWQVFGDADRNIPVELFRFQVSRSAPQGVYEAAGASHAIAASQPDAVTATVLRAVAYATAQ